jgi:hypothetical protein
MASRHDPKVLSAVIHGVVLFPRRFDFGGAIESATLTSTRVQPIVRHRTSD